MKIRRLIHDKLTEKCKIYDLKHVQQYDKRPKIEVCVSNIHKLNNILQYIDCLGLRVALLKFF